MFETRTRTVWALACAGLLAATVGALPTARAEDAPPAKSACESAAGCQEGQATILQTDGPQVKITVSGPDGQTKELKAARVEIRQTKGTAEGKPHAREAGSGEAAGEPAGWLGVRISPVPAAVGKHLAVGEGEGVMILNVVRGSPAEEAKLARYDVVVALGKDERVGPERFAQVVRAYKPGEQIDLSLIHNGKRRQVAVKLVAPPPPDAKWEYVYEEDEDEQWSDSLKLHRGMLRKTPDGKWIFEGRPWNILPPAPEGTRVVPKVLPGHPWSSLQVQAQGGGGKASFSVSRTTDGKTIQMQTTDGDEIEVRRTEKDDKGKVLKSSTVRYKDEQELQKGDPDAYQLYQSLQAGGQAGGKGLRYHYSLTGWPLTMDIDFEGKQAREVAEEVRKGLEDWAKQAADQAKVAAQKAKEEVQAARSAVARAVEPREARYEFDVDADGRIKVSVREGDTAAKLTFQDEREMKEKAPKLHEQYEKLLKGDR